MASAALPRPPTCSPEPLLEAARQGWGCREGGKGRVRWMEGTSQWAACWQLRKRPVFTFLLKEIVGILLQRALEPGRKHAWGGVLSHLHATLCLELGTGARRKAHCSLTGCGILGKSLHPPGLSFLICNMG